MEDKIRPFGVPVFTSSNELPGEKQKKIIPDKSGKGKHKVEEDKTSDTTKPPTEKRK